MRLLARLFGWLVLACAVIVFGADLFAFWESGNFTAAMLGELLFEFSPYTLNIAQVIVQRYLFPWLWDPPMIWLLNQPAAAVFAVLGVLLVIATRSAQKRRIFRSPT